MSQEFTPVFNGTAMRLDEDASNADAFAEFIGGTVLRDGEDENKRISVQMHAPENSDHVYFIHPGDYALMIDGVPRKMYFEDYEELFGSSI